MYERGRRYLQDLSGVTGGRYFEASRDLHDLDQSFAQIAEELRRQYSLGYYPKTHGTGQERRQLRVRVNRADVAVRARASYIYAPVRHVLPHSDSNEPEPKNEPRQPITH
jgi:VWFA-related protein